MKRLLSLVSVVLLSSPGWAITWNFDQEGDSQGWYARETPGLGSTSGALLRTEVRDGIWRVYPAAFAPGRTPALSLVSPQIDNDSALFDRVAMRLRLVHSTPVSGRFGLRWTNQANRDDPSSLEKGGAYFLVDLGRQVYTADWQEIAIGDLQSGSREGSYSPILWEGTLLEIRFDLVLAEADLGHPFTGGPADVPEAVEIDWIVLTGVEEQLQGELPPPAVSQSAPPGELFAPAVFYGLGQEGITNSVDSYHVSAALGDLDGDKDLDLVATYRTMREGGWLTADNDGQGRFAGARVYPTPGLWAYVQGADVDGDGFMDVHVSDLGDSHSQLLRNDTKGGWEVLDDFQDLWRMGLVDGDGDGHADLWMFSASADQVRLWLLRNDGAGHFAHRQELRLEPSPNDYTPSCLVQHLRHGRTSGILWAHQNGEPGYEITCLDEQGETVQEHLAVDMTLQDTPRLRYAGDLDLDGDVDLLVGKEFFSSEVGAEYRGLILLENKGGGAFVTHEIDSAVELQSNVSVLDVDADGVLDWVFTDSNPRHPAVLVYLGRRGGLPALEGRYPLRGQGGAVIGGDVDQDGDVDLVVLERVVEGQGGVYVLRNRLAGSTSEAGEAGEQSAGGEEGIDSLLASAESRTTWMPQEREWVVYSPGNSGLTSPNVTRVVMDGRQRVWAGTAGGGLACFDGSRWSVFTTANSRLPGNIIADMAFAGQGRLWIGIGKSASTDPGGLVRIDGTGWDIYTVENSPLPDDGVTALSLDENGGMWVGTMGGLAWLKGEQWQVYTPANSGLPAGFVSCLCQGRGGGVWVGTGGGLAHLEGGTWTVHTTANSGLPSNEVWSLSQDQGGGVWVGTGGGLAHLESGAWTVYTTANSPLPDNRVTGLEADGAGRLWVGTARSEKLAWYDGEKWSLQDLPVHNSTIYTKYAVGSILVDPWDNKWVASFGGGLLVYREGGVFLPVTVTAVEEMPEVNQPSGFSVSQNYPNPFNPQTWIPFEVAMGDQPVQLCVYNALGQPVRTLVDGRVSAGLHQVLWDGRDSRGQEVSSGTYLYRLRVGSQQAAGKMVKSE